MRPLAFTSISLASLATLVSLWLTTPQATAQMLRDVEQSTQQAPQTTAAERQVLRFLHRHHTGLADRQFPAIAKTLVTEAEYRALDINLVLAVIFVESSGYNFAVSPVGARGLMQLMPNTAEELARRHGHRWHGPDALFDPILNLKLGTTYLRELLDHYDDDIETALAAYNWGPGRVDRRLASGQRLPRLYPQLVRDALEQRIDQRS